MYTSPSGPQMSSFVIIRPDGCRKTTGVVDPMMPGH
jgi:hypothetical protein